MPELTYIPDNKLVTHVTEQSKAFLLAFYKGSTLPMDYNFRVSLFTSTKPLVNVEPKEDVVYEARVRGVTTLYDTYLRKTDFVILLNCPEITKRQQELSLHNKSVYRSEEPYLLLSANIPPTSSSINAQINALKDSVDKRKDGLVFYLQGEAIIGSAGYEPEGTPSANELMQQHGVGIVNKKV